MLILKRLRRNKGLSIQEVAERLGISRQKYSRIEKSPEELKDFFLADRIASIFSMPVEVLFERFSVRVSPLTLPEEMDERRDANRDIQRGTPSQWFDSEAAGGKGRTE
ncbi:helix-turn-helix domain-containing protein [Mesotoga sp. B105.6.4]|jgi:transcriptional regulator with XRE-family HTH domain|uniref:helix-turn-helix domain-containing protein n=1 Tax=Mesotoga sp. B105.6.4 TaxID=1582224 RepID=UPI000C18FDB7|nr:helix-turn-helix transcriptional regulator [Mesotoga sp. B105.6.4]PVD17186.1 XRE family transcriptional regulator [Mesotoga sp. Brook.08.105.5.1]